MDNHQRFMNILALEHVSPEGVEMITKMQETAAFLCNHARNMVREGQILTPIYFFFIQNEDGSISPLILPVANLPDKDTIGEVIRAIAKKRRNVIAVVHINEAYSLWRGLTKEDVKEIDEKYEGRVSQHPDCKDIVMFSLTCNANGKGEYMTKMMLIDESVSPRQIVDEKDWTRMDRMEGRMAIPFDLLMPIK